MLTAAQGGFVVSADTLLGQARGEQRTWTVELDGSTFTVNPSTGVVSGRGSRAALQRLVRAYNDAEMKAAALELEPAATLFLQKATPITEALRHRVKTEKTENYFHRPSLRSRHATRRIVIYRAV